jgi:hypothetical protein
LAAGQCAALQARYANLVSFGAHLPIEIQEIDASYQALVSAGCGPDLALVAREKERNAEWMRQNPWLSHYEPHLKDDAPSSPMPVAPVAERDLSRFSWVESSGGSIDDAKARALNRLGLSESEADFEIVHDARAGLFGWRQRQARVRATPKSR